jgi:hypothetical protein
VAFLARRRTDRESFLVASVSLSPCLPQEKDNFLKVGRPLIKMRIKLFRDGKLITAFLIRVETLKCAAKAE